MWAWRCIGCVTGQCLQTADIGDWEGNEGSAEQWNKVALSNVFENVVRDEATSSLISDASPYNVIPSSSGTNARKGTQSDVKHG